MKRPAQSFLLITLILVALPCGVWGATTVSASYSSESPLYLQQAPGAFTHPSVVGAKLGRLTITFSGGPLYNPGIQTSGSGGYGNVVLSGMIANCPDCDFEYVSYIQMAVVMVTYVGSLGSTPYLRTLWSSTQSLFPEENNLEITTSPVYVDFYLVNTNSTGRERSTGLPANLDTGNKKFDLSTQYTFNNPFNPTYALGVTLTKEGGLYQIPSSGEITNPNATFVEIDGVSGSGTTSFMGNNALTDTAGANNNQTGFWNGVEETPPPPVNFVFSFQNDIATFDLSEAYGENNKKTINVAQMDVQNGEVGTTYTQNLTFTDSGSAQSFQLKPVGVSGNTIGFKLYFGNSTNAIPYGQAFEWTGLVPNMNYKDLKIGGILESEVNQRTSGSYSDTITVTITAVP